MIFVPSSFVPGLMPKVMPLYSPHFNTDPQLRLAKQTDISSGTCSDNDVLSSEELGDFVRGIYDYGKGKISACISWLRPSKSSDTGNKTDVTNENTKQLYCKKSLLAASKYITQRAVDIASDIVAKGGSLSKASYRSLIRSLAISMLHVYLINMLFSKMSAMTPGAHGLELHTLSSGGLTLNNATCAELYEQFRTHPTVMQRLGFFPGCFDVWALIGNAIFPAIAFAMNILMAVQDGRETHDAINNAKNLTNRLTNNGDVEGHLQEVDEVISPAIAEKEIKRQIKLAKAIAVCAGVSSFRCVLAAIFSNGSHGVSMLLTNLNPDASILFERIAKGFAASHVTIGAPFLCAYIILRYFPHLCWPNNATEETTPTEMKNSSQQCAEKAFVAALTTRSLFTTVECFCAVSAFIVYLKNQESVTYQGLLTADAISSAFVSIAAILGEIAHQKSQSSKPAIDNEDTTTKDSEASPLLNNRYTQYNTID